MQAAPDRLNIKDSASIIQTKRVLLLEDSEDLKSLIKRFLESNSYSVEAVSHGAEGLRSIQKEEFDIIICDMQMPRLSGDRFYFAVKKAMPHLCQRFIFITGYTCSTKINDFIKQVNGTMITKPFLLDELFDAVTLIQGKTPIGDFQS